ncbi:MAG: protein-glutamate O-methyltransferase CheR [Pseudomonadales bacterium]|jgi:chemotaxis protein methyltransferase CheR|nr:protein-glutamate O-methyltransferase CheR [Pseudomonadales bacterium]
MTIARGEGRPLEGAGLSRGAFERVRSLLQERAGIRLTEAKYEMVSSRLGRRLRALGLHSYDAYLELVQAEDGPENEHFLNALTTNLTSFFREAHHFRHLQEVWLPEVLASGRSTIRIWSAGCSSGEEPYSIAMALLDRLPRDVRLSILATDLDSDVLARARSGVYPADRIRKLPADTARRWFQRGSGPHAGLVRVRPELSERISFRRLNLFEPWPMKKKVDAIFCRNVLIYFDKETQRPLVERFADQLVERGTLFIGHSETLFRLTERYESLGNTIYRRLS